MTSEDLKQPATEPAEPQTAAPKPDGELDDQKLNEVAGGTGNSYTAYHVPPVPPPPGP